MIHFVGAGPGAPDLITVRGQKALSRADVVVYAGSLVNPELLRVCKPHCEIYDSAGMTLEEVMRIMLAGQAAGKNVVRLHTGDPSIFGAIREQMDRLQEAEAEFEVIPGVSAFLGAAAALKAEFTLPGVSQTIILTRMGGRTPVPEAEDIALLAAHRAGMAIFLSASMLEALSGKLLQGGYTPKTPVAIIYKATWADEKIVRTDVSGLSAAGKTHNISKTAMVLVGDFMGGHYERSRLYDPSFTHGFRNTAPNRTGADNTDNGSATKNSYAGEGEG